MKTLRIILSSIALVFFVTGPAKAQVNVSANISFNTFYDALSPYGQWIDMPRYGKVWLYKEAGFRPYATGGYWEQTTMGNSWVSEYPWGWAPFHYGRWELDPYYGWIWIPGYEYAPAWVTWSQVDGYYGWAPLGFGIDINISIGRIPYDRWMYAPYANIYRPSVYTYCVPYNRVNYYYQRQRPTVVVYSAPRRGNPHYDQRYDRGHYDRYDNAPRRDNNYRDNNRGNVQAPPVPQRPPVTGSRPDRPYSVPENNNNNRGNAGGTRPNMNNNNNGGFRPNMNNNPRTNQTQRLERTPASPDRSREMRSAPGSGNAERQPASRSRLSNMVRR